MAIKHSLTIRYYLRMLAWIFLLYVVWCFAPTLYSEARFRIAVFQEVNEAASSGESLQQIRETLLFKADALRIPLAPADLEVSPADEGRRVYAHYAYEATVTCFKQTVTFDFTGSHSADGVIRYTAGNSSK